MSDDSFDVVVIGAGPGGYVCALRAAQLGLRVACVDARETPGGVCLNVGCIPSKALLHATEVLDEVRRAGAVGVKTGRVTADLDAMMAHKRSAVTANTKGVAFLLRRAGVTFVTGTATVTERPGEIDVVAGGEKKVRRLTGAAVVLAPGSEPSAPTGIAIDEEGIVSSTGALEFTSVPRRLVVVGAGVIGLELGSVWARLGSEVTVIEFLDRVMPEADADVAGGLRRLLEKQGLSFRFGRKVLSARPSKGGVEVVHGPASGEEDRDAVTADRVLVAVGRRPRTRGLGLETPGVACDERGAIRVDASLRTNVEGVYALGDAVRGPMLAHKASEEGVAVAERLAGRVAHVNYEAVPSVVYTTPEAAWVGRTEESLKRDGVAYRVGKVPFMANGRAKASGTPDGFVKMLADAATDRVLGVHVLGAHAGEMIAEAVVAMEFSASSEDLARTCHAHPTLSETIKEAALAVDGRALHA